MPSTTEQVLELAEKLGQTLSQHPAVEKYRQAQRSVADDPEAARLLREFDRQLETLARQEASGGGITDAQRRALESLQAQIASHLKVKALNIAQVEFTDLLRRVSQTWQRPLMGESSGQASSSVAAPRGPRLAT